MNAPARKVITLQRLLLFAWATILFGLFVARVSRFFVHPDGSIGISAGWDLRGLWDLNKAILDGINPYPYALRGQCYDRLDFDGDCIAIVNSPLFWLLTSPVAALEWESAEVVWFLINIGSCFAIIWIIESKLLPPPIHVHRLVLLVLVFFASGPVSAIILIGQTSLIIMVFAIAGYSALSKKPVLAGILLGLAFSKYSLTFLLALFLLFDRRYRTLLTAILVQLLGLVFISIAVNATPQIILADYFALVRHFAYESTELNLHSRIVDLGLHQSAALTFDLIGLTATIFTILAYIKLGANRSLAQDNALLLPFLLIASIPFVYHRHYDAIVLILLAVPYYCDTPGTNQARSHLHYKGKKWLVIVTGLVLVVFFYPRTIIRVSDIPALLTSLTYLDTITILLAWFVLLLRLWHTIKLPAQWRNAVPFIH